MIRRRVQVSLTAVLVLITGIAIVCAYVARIQQRSRAMNTIHDLGGAVRTESGAHPRSYPYFERVIDVQFMGSPVGDDDLDQLVEAVDALPELTKLILVGTSISRDGLMKLESALPQVEIHFSNPIDMGRTREMPLR